jgi:uncharacterized membrane protein YagU involved in acid resistance
MTSQAIFPFKMSSALYAVLWGGLIAGVLDTIDAVIVFKLVLGMNPIQILQYIASGVLGQESFRGGLATAALGALIHFSIAFSVAAIYYVVSTTVGSLSRKPIRYGLLYGVVVYLMMTYVVLPMSAVPPIPFSLALFLNGTIGHALFVGLPIAVCSRRALERTRAVAAEK